MLSSTLTMTACVSFIAFSLASTYSFAAKPMTETDLGDVSAETGSNILNLLGAPAAGLTIEQGDAEDYASSISSEQQKTYKEGETTAIFAIEEIKSLEKDSMIHTGKEPDLDVDISAFEEAIYASKQTIGIATSLDFSNSEIKYFDKDVHHDLTIISDNNIKVTRDLKIEQLSIDELKTTDNGPSAGSIYLSDWISQGSTRILSTN